MAGDDLPRADRALIVNADDFGYSPPVNRGIVRAHRDGILTSATLLANGPAFGEAVELSRANPGLGVGIHLNLVRGRPLSPANESFPLVRPEDGLFRPFRWRRMDRLFLRAAEAEYRRQIERVLASGIVPTHIDFEKHHAWQYRLYGLACRLAREYGVPAVRTLREPVAWSVRRLGWPGIGPALMAGALRTGFEFGGGLVRPGLARPDRLLGQCHIGAMTEAVWLRLAEKVPAGLSEVMTHPGEAVGDQDTGDRHIATVTGDRGIDNRHEAAGADGHGTGGGDPVARTGGHGSGTGVHPARTTSHGMGGSWLEAARRVELEALTSPRVKAALAGVRLVHFGIFSQGDGVYAGRVDQGR
ncbi:MAG: ChbG/HpnK family deacetylase [Planctomycetes bacterium]|nr:ChbG/HpnK family deacetylase [Planctomycetota bacterium]MCD7897824.1 ChbG/HpnK family deacetylase [Planctomycetaceae bacterium]